MNSDKFFYDDWVYQRDLEFTHFKKRQLLELAQQMLEYLTENGGFNTRFAGELIPKFERDGWQTFSLAYNCIMASKEYTPVEKLHFRKRFMYSYNIIKPTKK